MKLIENPLAKAEPVVLKPKEIIEREKSPVSIMPKGLLDKLSRDEILDLVAYIAVAATTIIRYSKARPDHSAQCRSAAGHAMNTRHISPRPTGGLPTAFL